MCAVLPQVLKDKMTRDDMNAVGGAPDSEYPQDGTVDLRGNPVLKANTGGWKACPYILGNECCERLAYYGIATNLVTYLSHELHQNPSTAANNVTNWSGTCYITTLIGAFLADAYLGRFWTIVVFSIIYFLVCTRSPFDHKIVNSIPGLIISIEF